MSTNKLNRVFMKALCLLIAAMAWPSDAAGYSVYIVEPAVTNKAIVAGQPLPEVCQLGDVLQISACRGEFEPASFVVVTENPLEAVRVEVGALTGPGGELARDAVDVRIARQWVWEDYVHGMLPPLMVLVKDDAMLVEKAVPTQADPNARRMTAPNGLRDSAELQPANIADVKQFWLTVHVPDDAEPGAYEAAVRVIPANAPPTELTLRLTVHAFELLAPTQEYSLYYPACVVPAGSPDWRTGEWTNVPSLTHEQAVLELKNMVAHGVTNPNIYTGVGRNADGTLDFSRLERMLAAREQAGIGPGIPIYAMNGAGEPTDKPLSNEEKYRITEEVRQVMAWYRQRGYDEIYWAGLDEATGTRLANQRDSYEAIHAGGGKVFTSCFPGFDALVGDLLDRPVLHIGVMDDQLDLLMESLSLDHPRMLPLDDHAARAQAKARLDAEFEAMISIVPARDPLYRSLIDGTHERGNKIFTYGFPWSAWQLPATHRHHYGLGLWQMGLDGCMNYAFAHVKGDLGPDPINQSIWGYVVRTQNGVLDKLQWEGFREGVDDARYLATVLDALEQAAAAHPNHALVLQARQWLNNLQVAPNELNDIRAQMVRAIVALEVLNRGEAPPAEVFEEEDASGEQWDVVFTGHGLPTEQGWGGQASGSQFAADRPSGYLMTHGNPGGKFVRRLTGYPNTGGWTVEWAFRARNLHQLPGPQDVVAFGDDVSLVRVCYTTDAVILKDHTEDNAVRVPLDLEANHTYRLVRQRGGRRIALHIDDAPTPTASLLPADGADPGYLNTVEWGNSLLQGVWDFFRYRRGVAPSMSRLQSVQQP